MTFLAQRLFHFFTICNFLNWIVSNRCINRRIRIDPPQRNSFVKSSKKPRQSSSCFEDVCRTVHGCRSPKYRTTGCSSTFVRLLRNPREGWGGQVRRHTVREQGQPRENRLHLQQAQLLHRHTENGVRPWKRSKAFWPGLDSIKSDRTCLVL